MIVSFDTEKDAAGFADDLNQTFGSGSASITTTPQGKFVVCYAPTVTGTSSEDFEDLVDRHFSTTQVST